MLISPVILPAAGVHFTNLGVACRPLGRGMGRLEGFPIHTIKVYLTGVFYPQTDWRIGRSAAICLSVTRIGAGC